MHRVAIPELLDTDSGTESEVLDSLADLRWFNRYFGGIRTTVSLVRRTAAAVASETLTYLDVAGASGDGARAAQEELQRHDRALRVILLDRVATHMPAAADRQGTSAVVADAMALPFADRSFDLVGSSLFLHHLQPAQVTAFLRESLRVCRHAVLINDLRRDPLHWLTAVAGKPLYRSRLTRNDAPASVRQAYTMPEVLKLIPREDAGRIEASRHYFYRMGIIVWRRMDA